MRRAAAAEHAANEAVAVSRKPLIRARGLSKVYATRDLGKKDKAGVEVRAIDGVDFDIEAGDYVAIVGASGSGKSTLMQMLGLLDRPSSGSLELNGQDSTGLSDDALAGLRNRILGFVFQSFNLLPRTPARDNVALPLLYAQHPDPLFRAEQVLKQLELADRLDHAPHQLSGGQQQRVAIARALATRPRILLADEPTGNLPSLQAHEIIRELERLNKAEGVTLLLVTHDPALARRAGRCITLHDGKIQSDRRQRPLKKRALAQEKSKKGPLKAKHSRLPSLATLKENLRMALISLGLNKLRTFLTLLGVVIGVAALITMTAISQGAQAQIKESLAEMGSNLLVSWPGGSNIWTPFSEADEQAVRGLSGKGPILVAIPNVRGSVSAAYGPKNANTQIQGTLVAYEAMRNSKPLRGRFFTADEEARRARVCLIGRTVINNLFEPGVDPTGSTIKINKQDFRVIGVLPVKGASWRDEDDIIIVPLGTAMARVLGKTHVDYFDVQAKDSQSLPAAEELFKSTLRRSRRIAEGAQDNFVVRNLGQIQEAQDSSAKVLSTLILAIAALSLFVGGIGIMNIMLVTVRERTREIGLRKALGARNNEVLFQFVVEAALVGLIGGLVGAAVGCGGSLLLAAILKWRVILSPIWAMVAVASAALTALISGLWPAVQASRLAPTEALRYE